MKSTGQACLWGSSFSKTIYLLTFNFHPLLESGVGDYYSPTLRSWPLPPPRYQSR